jgi:hypothetical protein
MNHTLVRPASPTRRAPSWLQPLSALGQGLAGACRASLARDRMPWLDAAALRDLGISRSELPSFEAEADGRAERTRRRLLDQRRAGI